MATNRALQKGNSSKEAEDGRHTDVVLSQRNHTSRSEMCTTSLPEPTARITCTCVQQTAQLNWRKHINHRNLRLSDCKDKRTKWQREQFHLAYLYREGFFSFKVYHQGLHPIQLKAAAANSSRKWYSHKTFNSDPKHQPLKWNCKALKREGCNQWVDWDVNEGFHWGGPWQSSLLLGRVFGGGAIKASM